MPSVGERFREKIGEWFGKPLEIADVRDVTPHFRRMRVRGDWLRSAACAAGDKLQIMVAEAGPRTYTPFGYDATRAEFELLAFVHGDTPGARWMRRAQAGETFHAIGPRGSLPLASLTGPVVFFGDETSLGAAASLLRSRTSPAALAFVFESSVPDETDSVLRELGFADARVVTVVTKEGGEAQLAKVEAAVREALTAQPDAQLVLTGHAQSIQALRARLKAQPVAYAGQKVKAYWADGKRGLD